MRGLLSDAVNRAASWIGATAATYGVVVDQPRIEYGIMMLLGFAGDQFVKYARRRWFD